MNSSCTQTNLVLDGLLALLACGKCKQTAERPIRFVICGHLFCGKCAENDTVCAQCRTPVERNEKRPHNTIARLIDYCATIKEMISNLDSGDLWPLANAIHRLTAEQGEKIEETLARANEKCNDTISEPIIDSCVDSPQSVQREKHYSHRENATLVKWSRGSEKSNKNDFHAENTSFVHSTQIMKRRGGECETAGYVDPTEISPIHGHLYSDSETPGYRDATQAIRQLNESNYDPETPGYRDPTQMSNDREERDSADETLGYVGPTQITPLAKKTNKKLRVIAKSETPSVANWQDDMELDKDLYSPIPDDTLVAESLDTDASISDEAIIPETLDVDVIMRNDPAATLTAANAKDLPTETEKSMEKKLTRQAERIKTLQRKTYPMSDYDTVREKAPLRFNRRLTDPALERRYQLPTDDFDTLSIPDIRRSFMDDVNENEGGSVQQLRRIKIDGLDKRQNRIVLNDRRCTPSVANARDEFVETLNKEQEPIKQRRTRDSSVYRRNWITTNDREKSSVAEEKASPKKLGRTRNWNDRLDRRNKIPINPRGTLDDFSKDTEYLFETERIADNATLKNRYRVPMADDERENTPMGSVEKAKWRNGLGCTRDAIISHSNETAMNDRNALVNDNTLDTLESAIKAAEADKQARLHRRTGWTNRETMESPFTNNAAIKASRRSSNSMLDEREKSWTNTRDTRDLGLDMRNVERVDRIGRIKNLAMHRLNEDSLSDRDTMGLVDGADSAETALFETESIAEKDEKDEKDEATKRPSKIRMGHCDITGMTNMEMDTAMEIGETREEKAPPKHLERLTDWPLNERERDSINDSDTLDVANIVESIVQFEKVTSSRQLGLANDDTIRPSDLDDIDITNIKDFTKEKVVANGCEINDSDTVDISDVGDLLDEPVKIPPAKRPLHLTQLVRKSKADDCGIDITNIQHFAKEKLSPNGCRIIDSREPEKIPQVRALKQLKRLRKSNSAHQSTNIGDHIQDNIQDSRKEEATTRSAENLSIKRSSKSPPNDYYIAGNVENSKTETQNKMPAKRAKAKIVQLKARRRENEKTAAVPKAIPKNVNKRNVKGETVLHNACVKGQADYVASLLEAGANPNTKDNANWTPLQEVVKLGRREICEMLLQFGASPDTPGIENRTALHEASQNDKVEEATLLLRFNAKRDVYDKYGKRPIDYAVSDAMRRVLLADDLAVEKIPAPAPAPAPAPGLQFKSQKSKVIVLPVNLNSANKKALSRIAAKLKLTVVAAFGPGVTHIIVEANERNTTDLTHSVMFAILEGVWILNSQWIAISMDLNDISDIDLELFEVHGAPNPGTPERSRMNAEKQNPRLFNNCFFYLTIGARSTWKYGNLELTKASLTNLVLAGQGELLRREPDPEDVKDNEISPFHVADKPMHSLYRCSHYIIYMPGRDEPRIKYNMPHIKTLPLAWFIECIEKFSLVDPVLIGIS